MPFSMPQSESLPDAMGTELINKHQQLSTRDPMLTMEETSDFTTLLGW